MTLTSSLSEERAALEKEVLRLQREHESLRRTRGGPFDWDAHRRHLESLKAISKRLKEFRDRVLG
jgi:hypothetical protein